MSHSASERFEALCALADEVTLKSVCLDVLKKDQEYPIIARIIENQLKKREDKKALLLPDLHRQNDSIVVFSDYGGDSPSSAYHTYSFLVCAWDPLGIFLDQMKEIREKYNLDNPFKEISFKDFRYGQISRALSDYLRTLDNFVIGFLFTVIIEKNVKTLFGADVKIAQKFLKETLEHNGFGSWKPKTAERLFTIIHIAAYLIALLSRDGQKVFWTTDNDAIVPNKEKAKMVLNLFSSILTHYSSKKLEFTGGSVPFDEKDTATLDLLSATDIVAGAVEHSLSRSTDMKDLTMKEGAEKVLQWLAHDGVCLKKQSVIIRQATDGMLSVGTLTFQLERPDPNATVIPIAR